MALCCWTFLVWTLWQERKVQAGTILLSARIPREWQKFPITEGSAATQNLRGLSWTSLDFLYIVFSTGGIIDQVSSVSAEHVHVWSSRNVDYMAFCTLQPSPSQPVAVDSSKVDGSVTGYFVGRWITKFSLRPSYDSCATRTPEATREKTKTTSTYLLGQVEWGRQGLVAVCQCDHLSQESSLLSAVFRGINI